jgi:uncharacterized protein (DUF2147 family)
MLGRSLAAMAMLIAGGATAANAGADLIEGRWLTQAKDGIVEIYRCAPGSVCGRLLWLRLTPADNDPQAIDNRNPAPQLRNRPLCGLMIMWGFRQDGNNSWSGSIYDPASGNTYQATMALRPDGTLDVRGYVLISLFGRSEIWTRFGGPIPACPGRD